MFTSKRVCVIVDLDVGMAVERLNLEVRARVAFRTPSSMKVFH